MRYKIGATVYRISIAAVYAMMRPTANDDQQQFTRNGVDRDILVAPFQLAARIALCSRPAAWMPLMIVPHMPSCPTTS